MKHLNDNRNSWQIKKAIFSDKGMNSEKLIKIEKDNLLSQKTFLAGCYFVPISKVLNFNDSPESHADNIGSDIIPCLSKKVEKTDDGDFRFQTISIDKLKKMILNQQKQPSRGFLKKRCSEKIQQIYTRTPMP